MRVLPLLALWLLVLLVVVIRAESTYDPTPPDIVIPMEDILSDEVEEDGQEIDC